MDFLASLASGGLNGLFSGVGTLAKDIKELWTGEPSPEKQLLIQQKLMELESAAMLGQMQINMEEAKSEHIFVSGWRPAVGWIGALAFGYSTIVEPLMTWIAKAMGSAAQFPALDSTLTMQILFGILGLGAYRSFDKAQSPAPKGKE